MSEGLTISDRLAFGAVVLAFGALWSPLGQHAFLIEHWMKVGAFMAPFLLLIGASRRDDDAWRSDPSFLSLALLVAYILHQVEEHWIDVYGRVYAFKPYLNDFLAGLTGAPTGTEFMSDASIFVINTSLVWLVGALAIWRGSEHVFAALCMAAIVVVNAVSHIGAAALTGAYNPGLLTGVLVFLPLGAIVYAALLRSGAATTRLALASLAWGVVAHVVMIAGILMMHASERDAEPIYFAVLILWSVLPSLVFRARSPARPSPSA